MDEKIKVNITEKLLRIVKERNTPIIVKKQDTGYKSTRYTNSSIAFSSEGGYSYSNEE